MKRRIGVLLSMAVISAGVGAADELDLLPLGDAERAYQVASAPAGAFYDCRSNEALDLDGALEALDGARVILLGEEHTSMEQKRFHAELLAALAERGRPLVLGMEFFLRSDDQVLARWGRGELDDDALLRAVGWYDRGGYRWAYYRPVMEVARRHGIPVIGLNVPRDIPRTVNRSGLEGLTEEQRTEVGTVDVEGSPQHRYLVSRYFGETVALMPQRWLDNMYAAQSLWDVVMARSILAGLPDGATMVVVVGAGHVAYGLGIPRRLAEERARAGEAPLEVAVLCPVTAPAPDPEGSPHGHPMGMGGDGGAGGRGLFVRSLADVVAVFADDGGVEAYPRLGLQLEEDDEAAAVVRMVFPESLAEEADLQPGDRLVLLNGREFDSLSDLRWRLAELEWGERLQLTVARDGERLERAVLLYPEIASEETTTAPGWSVRPAPGFDPAGDEAVPAPVDHDPRDAILLVRGDRPVRVEVRVGGTLQEVHELDAAGRVVRSLYKEPRPDGAVEVVLERDSDGDLLSADRRTRDGSSVD